MTTERPGNSPPRRSPSSASACWPRRTAGPQRPYAPPPSPKPPRPPASTSPPGTSPRRSTGTRSPGTARPRWPPGTRSSSCRPTRGAEQKMPAGGYFGQALVVDASTGTAETLTLPDDVLRAYVGGAGLGAWLMHRLAPPDLDPLGAEAP